MKLISSKADVSLINFLETQRFVNLLNKLSSFQFNKKNIVFVDEDKEKLRKAFQLNNVSEVNSLIDSCVSIFTQAVYHLLSTSALKKELLELEFNEEKIIAISSVWKAKNKDLIANARNQTINPVSLSTVDYSLNLKMATSKLSSGKFVEPNVLLNFGLDSNGNDLVKENFTVEFDHQELYNFFNQLETIQKQLDASFT